MTTQAQLKRTGFTPVVPVEPEDLGVENPTAVRYGWMPLDDINLYNGDGTPYYFIQPVNSPYHRILPPNQLIPFETFTRTKRVPDDDYTPEPGKPARYLETTETITAHQAATELLRTYSAQGYTMLKSLQGIPQEDAFRIWQVVQPYDYENLEEMLYELEFGSEQRIASTEIIELAEDYKLAPLRSDTERFTARKLAGEMLVATRLAHEYAVKVLDDTQMDIIATAGGRKEGKKGGDARDRRYEIRLGRKLPNMFEKNDRNSDLAQKVDYLVESEQSRRQAEENAALKARVAELEAARTASPTLCGYIKENNEPCEANVMKGKERCYAHRDK